MMKRHVIEGVEVWEGSGNVFADLGMPNAEEHQIKSGLMGEIAKAMRRRGLTQQAAAEIVGIPQPRLSAALRGDFSKLSERKLMGCLNRLGYDIEIKVKRTRKAVGSRQLALA